MPRDPIKAQARRKKWLAKHPSYHVEWERKNPWKKKGYRFKRVYGITMNQLETMFVSQNGRCAICLREFNASNEMCVDHNHTTGLNRELLCSRCNILLGQFEEDTDILKRAVVYLEKWKI